MQFQIILRQTEDWGNTNLEQWLASHRKKFGKRPKHKFNQFNSNVVEWNEKYIPSYFEYRATLHSIARQTWNATGLKTVPMEALTCDDFTDEDTIFIPTDDDDWFRPDIAKHLEKAFENKNISRVMWRGWIWHKHGFFKQVGLSPPIAGNGYAIRASITNYFCLVSNEWMKNFGSLIMLAG